MEKNREALELLKEFGLNTYEAKSYLALIRLSGGTAPEVSREAGVPPQRVYDSLSSLEEKGFIKVVNRKPRYFVPLPVREALINRIYQLKTEFERREKFLRSLVEEIEKRIPQSSRRKTGEKEVFTLEGEKAVVSTALSLISSARSSVKIAGVRPLFTFGCRGNLEKYLKEGVELVAVGKFDTPCKEEIKKLGGKYYERQVKAPYLLIVDDEKLLYIYSGNRGLVTENEEVVMPFISYKFRYYITVIYRFSFR
jgi:sugar-specific transcriptional regulator TrmB